MASSASILAQTATQSGAAQPSEETISIPQFTVSSERADAYRVTDAFSDARIRGALIDTPATINVVTSEFIHDVGANSILDATQYFAGISPGRLSGTNGIADRTLIRGFETFGRTIDNISTSYQAQVNPELIERVEVVKGPNSILAPTGSPGGSLNVITKAPKYIEENDLILEVGRYNANKATVDSTGPISAVKGLAYRLVASSQDAKTFVPKNQRSWDINPSFLYKIGDHSQITFKATYMDWAAHGAAASPTSGIWANQYAVNGAYVTPSNIQAGLKYNGDNLQPNWAARTDKVAAETIEFTSALTENINMRLAASTNTDKFKEDDVFTSYGNGGGSFYDPYTGVYTPTSSWSLNSSGVYVPTTVAWPDGSNTDVQADLAISKYTDSSLQNDFAGRFETNGVKITPVVGWLYQERTGTSWEREKDLGSYNLLAAHAEFPHYARSQSDELDTDIKQSQKQFQGYAYVQGAFLQDRILTTAGVSRITVDNWSIDHNSNDAKSTLKGSHYTYSAGILGKVTKNVSAYYSYSSNAQATDAGNNAPPRWQDGKQHEVGFKAELFEQRLGINIAHFRITQNNISTPNPYRYIDANAPAVLFQDQKNDGLEFEVTGGLTKELSVIASYTNMHLRDTLGRRVRNVPDETANILLNYHYMKNASVFVGLLHTGDTAGETAPGSLTALGVIKQVSFYVPPHTLLNAGTSYSWDRFTFALNVDNITNEKGVWQASGRGGLQGLTPINVKGTVRIKF